MSLKLNSSGGGSVTLQEPVTASTQTLNLPNASGTLVLDGGSPTFAALTVNGNNISATNSLGFRNRIINGDMRIDQRNAGASVTPSATALYTYLVDRWAYNPTQASKMTWGQNLNSVTPPVGYTNYLGGQVGASANVTVGSSDYFFLRQVVEGLNLSDFSWGTANAQTITLSFWVRSSLTGTFGGTLENSALNRGYPFSYVISAANTWEQKFLTIVGDTTGTWLTNIGTGVDVRFGLGAGTTFQGAAGSWQAINTVSATGAVNLIATNGATFYITGVQLEAGTVATPFERRPYGTEFNLCLRYTNRISAYVGGVNGYVIIYPEPMRVAPTATVVGGSLMSVNQIGTTSQNWNNDSSPANTATVLNSAEL
jgi:hypothetical protein